MKSIRITLIRSLPSVKVFIDRFIDSLRIRINHIDHAVDHLSTFIKIKAKIISENIEDATIKFGLRFPIPISHKDYDDSSLKTFYQIQSEIKSIDHSTDHLYTFIKQQSEINHIDYDTSHLSAMLVYPVALGELTEMALGEMSNKSLKELTFNEIQI